jgi:putative membrane protein
VPSPSELAGIASAKGTTPSDDPGPAAMAVQETLEALAADGFDTEYMAQQAAGHAATLALFETCAAGCIDPEIRGFAAKQVPVIQDHLGQAQDLKAKAKAKDQAAAG